MRRIRAEYGDATLRAIATLGPIVLVIAGAFGYKRGVR